MKTTMQQSHFHIPHQEKRVDWCFTWWQYEFFCWIEFLQVKYWIRVAFYCFQIQKSEQKYFFLTVWVFLCWKLHKILLTILILHWLFYVYQKTIFINSVTSKFVVNVEPLTVEFSLCRCVRHLLRYHRKLQFRWQKSLFR